MANPRVFISSTCYDLTEVRDNLIEFIQSFGFIPVLSERGDVFYHPDIHTHDSCLNEVSNCDLFILMIGGRFGGSYVTDKKKSIVNAEYATAKECKIPVFTFIKRAVYSDHHFHTKNKAKEHIAEMDFPSIDKREDAEKIFEFIDEVRKSDVNNGFFSFEFAREIVDLLRKQWSGMFYDFLQDRKHSEQQKITTNLLTNISDANERVKELVKRLYRQLDESGADEVFEEVEEFSIARKFIDECYFLTNGMNKKIDPSVHLEGFDKWYEYFAEATGGTIKSNRYEKTVSWQINESSSEGLIVEYLEKDPDTVYAQQVSFVQQQRFEVAKKIEFNKMKKLIIDVNKSHYFR